jgi:hypothetical protein
VFTDDDVAVSTQLGDKTNRNRCLQSWTRMERRRKSDLGSTLILSSDKDMVRKGTGIKGELKMAPAREIEP